tara:strand:- start:218 stop:967 length:750 start_codon:yes stop_codon:yes gene_type:complete
MKKLITQFFAITLLGGILTANTYSGKDLVPPSSHDVFAFSNGKPPASGSRYEKDETQILKHLDKGKVFYSRKALTEYLKDQSLHGVEIYDRNFTQCDGVIATRDERIIFWNLMSQNVLHLETANHEHCYLLYLDKWSKKAIEELKKYQYSQQAGRKRYTPSIEETIQSYDQSKMQCHDMIEREMKALRELYSAYETASDDEKNALLREVSIKRSIIEHMEIQITEIDRRLKPLKLKAEFPTPRHTSITH